MKKLPPSTRKKIKLAILEIILVAILCNIDRFMPVSGVLLSVMHLGKVVLIGLIFLVYYICIKKDSEDTDN